MGLLKLAERLEHASGEYDPLLCSDIHDVLPEPKCVQPPNYCASLDAAMRLVPEGIGEEPLGIEIQRINLGNGSVMFSVELWNSLNDDVWSGHSDNSLTLALCAAALRARASNG